MTSWLHGVNDNICSDNEQLKVYRGISTTLWVRYSGINNAELINVDNLFYYFMFDLDLIVIQISVR